MKALLSGVPPVYCINYADVNIWFDCIEQLKNTVSIIHYKSPFPFYGLL